MVRAAGSLALRNESNDKRNKLEHMQDLSGITSILREQIETG